MPSKACHPQRRWLDGPIASVQRRCSKYWPLAGKRVGAGNGRVFEQEPHEASLPVTDFTPRKFLQNISSVSQPNRESTTTSVTCVALFYSIKDAPTSSLPLTHTRRRKGFNTPTVRSPYASNGFDEQAAGTERALPSR